MGDAPNLTHLATRRNAGNRKRLEQLQLLLSRVKRFERSEAVERLERLEPAAALRGAERLNDWNVCNGIRFWQGSQSPRGLKQGIRKILTGSLCLLTPAC